MNFPNTVVFDLDGTLIDSLPAIHVALNQILDGEGMATVTREQVRELVGFGAKWMINEIHEILGRPINDAKLRQLTNLYLKAYMQNSAKHTIVYEGVYEVLEILNEAGVKMGVCTNKPGPTTRPVLESLNLDHFFGAIVSEDDVKNRKPDAQHVLQTIKAVGGSVFSSVFVGDSETDMLAAQNTGIPAICVTYGYCHVPYEDLHANCLVSNFMDLPKALIELQDTK